KRAVKRQTGTSPRCRPQARGAGAPQGAQARVRDAGLRERRAGWWQHSLCPSGEPSCAGSWALLMPRYCPRQGRAPRLGSSPRTLCTRRPARVGTPEGMAPARDTEVAPAQELPSSPAAVTITAGAAHEVGKLGAWAVRSEYYAGWRTSILGADARMYRTLCRG